MDSLQTILAVATANKWYIEQMDVVSAYLAGTLDEEIYMDAPEGLGYQKGTTVRLIKSIYGLKQSRQV